MKASHTIEGAATFGWLCVETFGKFNTAFTAKAATFGWLCVETKLPVMTIEQYLAATFGWLCVETGDISK